MDIPVYLFTGFLEAGKTKFLQETLSDPQFNDGERILIIRCEEGMEELNPAVFPGGGSNVSVVDFDDPQLLTPDRLSASFKRSKAKRIMIEYNGMWNLDPLYRALPDNWFVCEEIFLADANTILSYNANMRQLVVDKLQSVQMVIFNRLAPGTDVMPLHRLVRAINRRANIGYEYTDGTFSADEIEDPLPFDMKASVITIADRDYAVWYSHISENMEEYDGKTVSFHGVVAHDEKMGNGLLAIGRQMMVCCEADTAFRPLVCKCRDANRFHTGDWVRVRGTIHLEESPYYQSRGPVMYVDSISSAEPADPPVATFY